MRKFAEELIIQTKTFWGAVLFVFMFILPWIYHFCGPRKITAACLEGGYHLATSNALLISGEKAWSHSSTSAEGHPGSNMSVFWAVQMAAFEQSPKGNFSLIYFNSNICLSPFYKWFSKCSLPQALKSILFRLSGLFYCYINSLLWLLLLLLLLLFQKSWPTVFVLWN